MVGLRFLHIIITVNRRDTVYRILSPPNLKHKLTRRKRQGTPHRLVFFVAFFGFALFPRRRHHSNYIICKLLVQSHMSRILRGVHALWQKSRIQRERNSSIFRNSNFASPDCPCLFTQKRLLPSKSVNLFQKGCLQSKSCIVKHCTP